MLCNLSQKLVRNPVIIRRSFASLNEAVLTRDFIKDALYNKDKGYNRDKKCGILEEPIDFSSLWGKWEFNKTIRSIYDKQHVNYMNAVELFTPYFSEAIAKYIIRKHKLGTPLNVMELANGSTTNATAMLRFMKSTVPNVYKNAHYYLLTDDLYFKELPIPEEFADKMSIISIKDAEKCLWMCESSFLIMNDVFSSLPHDKIRVPYGTKGDSLSQFTQCVVAESKPNHFEELYLPVSDPLIKHYIEMMLEHEYSMFTLAEHQNASIDAYNKHSALGNNRADRFKKYNANEAYIPTVLFDALKKVQKLTTTCHVIGYDFDYLPPCAEGDLNSHVNCINGPIVCSYDEKGNCTDANSYLVDKYKRDIFFSTDFISLKMMVESVTKTDGAIMKLNNFIKENSKIVNTRTMLGWNPLVKDFKNLSFILSCYFCCTTSYLGIPFVKASVKSFFH